MELHETEALLIYENMRQTGVRNMQIRLTSARLNIDVWPFNRFLAGLYASFFIMGVFQMRRVINILAIIENGLSAIVWCFFGELSRVKLYVLNIKVVLKSDLAMD